VGPHEGHRIGAAGGWAAAVSARASLRRSHARTVTQTGGASKEKGLFFFCCCGFFFSPFLFLFFLCDELAAGFGVVGGNSPKRCAFIYERGTRRFVWVRGVHDACGRGRW
jgi:hypothetical protein